MPADPLEQVLRLVAEGRLTADEAAPILAALDDRRPASAAPGEADGPARDGAPAGRRDEPFGFGGSATATSLRIEIRDGGRQVVNLRLPIAVGRFALDRVPGLSPDEAARVREALSSGMRGPVLEVRENDGDGVRILLE